MSSMPQSGVSETASNADVDKPRIGSGAREPLTRRSGTLYGDNAKTVVSNVTGFRRAVIKL